MQYAPSPFLIWVDMKNDLWSCPPHPHRDAIPFYVICWFKSVSLYPLVSQNVKTEFYIYLHIKKFAVLEYCYWIEFRQFISQILQNNLLYSDLVTENANLIFNHCPKAKSAYLESAVIRMWACIRSKDKNMKYFYHYSLLVM